MTDQDTTSTAGITVKVEGRSGAIRVGLSNGDYFRMALSRVEELDSTNQVVQVSNTFDNREVAWSPIVSGTFQDVAVKKVQFTTTLTDGTSTGTTTTSPVGTLTFIVYMFEEDGDIMWAGENFHVLKDQVKWTVEIVSWPWKSENNKLRVGVTMRAIGGKHPKTRTIVKSKKAHENRKPKNTPGGPNTGSGNQNSATGNNGNSGGGKKQQRLEYISSLRPISLFEDDPVVVPENPRDNDDVVLLGPAAFIAPTFAMINTPQSSPETMTRVEIESAPDDSIENGVTWIFPYFTNRLVFDPTVDVVGDIAIDDNSTDPVVDDPDNNDPGNDNEITQWVVLGVVGTCVAVGVGIGIFFMFRRISTNSVSAQQVSKQSKQASSNSQVIRR